MEDITGIDQQRHEPILVHILAWLLEISNLSFVGCVRTGNPV